MNAARKKGKRSPVSVRGAWIPVPLEFLRSRAWAELSPHAAKMLFDLCSMLGPNAARNGDLSASPAVMRPRGWVGTSTRVAALKELERAGLIAVMRQGSRRVCGLYAVTLWPLQCDLSKLDSGPGTFTTLDWEKARPGCAEAPTAEAPAKWTPLRPGALPATGQAENDSALPATGQPPLVLYPPRDNPPAQKAGFVPATGTKGHFLAPEVVPLGDTYLDTPSALAAAAVSPVPLPLIRQQPPVPVDPVAQARAVSELKAAAARENWDEALLAQRIAAAMTEPNAMLDALRSRQPQQQVGKTVGGALS